MQTPREIVRRALTFTHPERLPRQVWTLPWATSRYPEALADLEARFPPDIVHAPDVYEPSPRRRGDPFAVGTYVDEWGCAFENLCEGIIGEVREPLLRDDEDMEAYAPPLEVLPADPAKARDVVNAFCAATDRHVHAPCCPRPWERLQFLRGSEQAFVDLVSGEPEPLDLLRRIHAFHLRELEFWAATDVDGIMFMDDWGSQQSLLINPELWREIFKPLYRDYCDLAHAHGKFAFMHSDGNILSIYPDLAEIGVDAMNSQLFAMDMEELARVVKGRITFWGEIDRQYVLPSEDPGAVRRAVRRVADLLYDPSGGLIAQFEFGPGINPRNAAIVFEEWAAVEAERAAPSARA